MTVLVVSIVLVACTICMALSISYYKTSVEQNAITGSNQAVSQVQNVITNYTQDMNEIMEMIRDNMEEDEDGRNEFFASLILIRKDVEAIMVHSVDGEMLNCWSDGMELKIQISQNLSYEPVPRDGELYISAPHVQNLFENNYPWVVTISEQMQTSDGNWLQISMDIRFSNIAAYVDNVGIGTHGYCFIMDGEGNIVYHPQQQLIYAGLKEEETSVC